MHPRYYLLIAAFLFFLGACGRPDASAPSSLQTAKQAGGDIADLLRAPPAPGQTVEIDAYNWVGYQDRRMVRNIDYLRDAQGCPILARASLLSDWPIVDMLRLPRGWMSNSTEGYPPDDLPWLIPMPAPIIGSPGTAIASPGVPPSTMAPIVLGHLQIPPYARLRGHLGDPAFAACPHSDRIFMVDSVTAVYSQSGLSQTRPGDLQPPADYAAWPRYHDATMGYSFAYAPDWVVEPLQEANTLSAVEMHAPQAPNFPIIVRVHRGDSYYDPYEFHISPITIAATKSRRYDRQLESGSFTYR